MQDFRQLDVWRESRTVAKLVYESTARFPREELFGLSAQMRRAAVSVCANVAEGCGRRRDGEFGHFLSIALGSASELECEVVVAHDLDLLGRAEHDRLLANVIHVKRMLTGLMKTVSLGTR